MDENLCGTMLTVKKLRDLLQSINSTDFEVDNANLENVTGEVIGDNKGFTSKVLRIKLHWKEASSYLPKSVVAKVMGDSLFLQQFSSGNGEEGKENLTKLQLGIHNNEYNIYHLDGLNETVPMARCYINTTINEGLPGIIILEDLGLRGNIFIESENIMEGLLNPDRLDQVLQALAGLHAWSVNNTNWLGLIATCTGLGGMAEKFGAKFPETKKAFPERFKNMDENKVKEYINEKMHTKIFSNPQTRYNLPLVLVHGDIHLNNMVFQRNQDGDKLVALLDWQIAHHGCQMEDMARIFCLCISHKQRKEEGDKILQRYVQLFNGKVNCPENCVKYADCKRALDDMFAFNAVMWNCGMPLMMKSMMNPGEEEQKDKSIQHLLDYIFSSFQDAIGILGW